jgi:hypothetical protein
MKSRFASNVVCVGQGEAIGVIHQQGARGIIAVLSATGEKFGPFKSKAIAALELEARHREMGGGQ